MKKPSRELETPKVMHDAPLRDDDAAYFHFDEFAVTLIHASRITHHASRFTSGGSP